MVKMKEQKEYVVFFLYFSQRESIEVFFCILFVNIWYIKYEYNVWKCFFLNVELILFLFKLLFVKGIF